VVCDDSTIYVETAKANELFDSDDGIGTQQLSQ
jgi:hypothetical protein